MQDLGLSLVAQLTNLHFQNLFYLGLVTSYLVFFHFEAVVYTPPKFSDRLL